jgi:hypothetical protein
MEKIITWVVGGATTSVLAWIARYHDPLYSDGWFLNNPQWLYIPVIVAFAAVIMSLWTSGLVTLYLGDVSRGLHFCMVIWSFRSIGTLAGRNLDFASDNFCNDRRHRRRSREASLCLVAWSATGPGRHAAIKDHRHCCFGQKQTSAPRAIDFGIPTPPRSVWQGWSQLAD